MMPLEAAFVEQLVAQHTQTFYARQATARSFVVKNKYATSFNDQ